MYAIDPVQKASRRYKVTSVEIVLRLCDRECDGDVTPTVSHRHAMQRKLTPVHPGDVHSQSRSMSVNPMLRL